MGPRVYKRQPPIRETQNSGKPPKKARITSENLENCSTLSLPGVEILSGPCTSILHFSGTSQLPYPPPCPQGTSGVSLRLETSAGRLVCRSAGLVAAGCWSGLFSFRGPQGGYSRVLTLPFFTFFSHRFSNPPKSTFGANLAPTWCQNDLKKCAWESLRGGSGANVRI